MRFSPSDHEYMAKAIELSQLAEGDTHPNPCVGCVIVNDGIIVGEGHHLRAGVAHAEVEALIQAGDKARGATLYVNLEPCCHQGRTPPCTDAIIRAGVARVVCAMKDPNPLVSGGGIDVLRTAGVDVEFGLLEPEARWINRGFITRMMIGRPWVALKIGATLDGRTATQGGESQWITGSESREDVHKQRARYSAIMTGSGTVDADDPQMTVRLVETEKQPLRVIVDTTLRIQDHARIIGDDGNALILTSSDDETKRAELEAKGAEVVSMPTDGTKSGRINLLAVLEELGLRDHNDVFVECGGKLAGSLLEGGLVDELLVYYAPSVLGHSSRGMFDIKTVENLVDRPQFKFQDITKVGEDVRARAVYPPSMGLIGC
ncbi:MAG: bifunctional diaminohydroxyphosphoribosylaminopyrimidine deaminase/5-amino-6-(5-phosphoribosylamino)uracil reductase RibD [Proteobacteria bacterium]|jgi:diaminohydroxyphosphoribosylaminopyrimidine deaminase / 5-amino-6-(5-phosphoribosylamino)uracil reductase|nr:bifunctional diaminohydroxyphosphoribosylaminopyrimidine deaminase/5-amino-6-(5-phosphoribosylamino)uracil reductase RibD [Pseudomonadota bacterium]